MSKRNPITQIGITVTGKPIIGGLFKLADTYGFPLMCSIDECYKRGWTPSISAYIADALLAGWPFARAFQKVEEALSDIGRMDDLKMMTLLSWRELEENPSKYATSRKI